MAHPARAAMVDILCHKLPPATKVIWDLKNDRWDTGRRAMYAYNPKSRWHLVIQDDAILCDDFVHHATEALSCVPDGPVSFYIGRSGQHRSLSATHLNRARAQGLCWLKWDGPWWGVAIAVDTTEIGAMIAWGNKRHDILNYDRRLAAYFMTIGRKCWYSIPSLVDHQSGEDNPSLIPGRTGVGRRAIVAPRIIRGPWTSNVAHLSLADPTPRSLLHTLGKR